MLEKLSSYWKKDKFRSIPQTTSMNKIKWFKNLFVKKKKKKRKPYKYYSNGISGKFFQICLKI